MKKFLLAAGFIALLVVIGTADALLSRSEILANIGSADTGEGTGTVPAPAPREVAIPKALGPDVEVVVVQSGITVLRSQSEQSLLAQLGMDAAVETRVLIEGEDRIGSITWVTDGNVKAIFAALKQSLLESFSPQVQGLRDEREESAGYQTRSVLTFLDPSLGPERFLVVQAG